MAEIDLTEEFVRALESMESAREHVFVTGRAGTGKSTLLRHFMATTQRRAAVLAPTGLAALHVGGQTIHSFFRLPPRPLHAEDVKVLPPSQRRLFQELDTLIIDEISMVRADVLDAIDRSLRMNRNREEVPFGGVQIVAFGDLLQLAPVVQREFGEFFAESYETPYFFSANVLRHCDWRLIELTHNHRQGKDPDFFDLLTRLGHNELSERDFERLNARVGEGADRDVVVLTSTNAAAAAINGRRLMELPEDEAYYEAAIQGDFEDTAFPADATLVLKPGAQVMMVRNDPDRRWVNGDLGVVERCGEGELRVHVRGESHRVEPVSWDRIRYTYRAEDNRLDREPAGSFKQFPVTLAWAITIHKSQGQTLKRVVVDLGRGAFAHGQTYVALSRCESLDGLWLRRPLQANDIRFDDRVLSFLRRASVY